MKFRTDKKRDEEGGADVRAGGGEDRRWRIIKTTRFLIDVRGRSIRDGLT